LGHGVYSNIQNAVTERCVWVRNEDRTQQKIVDIQKDIEENQSKTEKLQNELKQMDVDARKLLDEQKQAKVL